MTLSSQTLSNLTIWQQAETDHFIACVANVAAHFLGLHCGVNVSSQA